MGFDLTVVPDIQVKAMRRIEVKAKAKVKVLYDTSGLNFCR